MSDGIREENILIQAGLSEDQAQIYDCLLSKGPQKASAVSSWTGVKRGLTYKILEQLEIIGLVEKQGGEGTVATYYPQHPSLLMHTLEGKEKELALAKEMLTYSLGALSSKYNLITGKPSVQFFEGTDGIKKVLEDTLLIDKNNIIYSYADLESIIKYIPSINLEYSKKREKLGIKKRGLLLDTQISRKEVQVYRTDVTETKFLSYNAPELGSVMQIYDNKISYITFSNDSMIGIIIEDKTIFEMHKALFEHTWETTPFPTSL